MRVPISWLKEFIDLKVGAEVRLAEACLAEALAQKFTFAGLEVESLEDVGNETVLVLGVTPNRPDWLGIVGVAREAHAVGAGRLKNFVSPQIKGVGSIGKHLCVQVKDKRACPRYTARVVDGVRTGPSPDFVRSRLAAVGIRSINNVVDATNYVMWEMGQPLHAFDRRFIRGNKIIVRKASPSRFVTLDGIERLLTAEDLLICDAQGPIAIAGVMGGANSEVKDDTTSVIIESAYFSPNGIRHTSRRLGLGTESSRRFERGVDPNRVLPALNRVVELVCRWSGGIATADWLDVYPAKIRPRRIALSPKDVSDVLGVACPASEMKGALTRLGCRVRTGKKWTVDAPTGRPDLVLPIDLIEEIGRLWGYHHIPTATPQVGMCRPSMPLADRVRTRLRAWLCANGFAESIHYSFMPASLAEKFSLADTRLAEASLAEVQVSIANPLGQEPTVLARSLIPNMVEAVALNLRAGSGGGRLFEMRRVYKRGANGSVEEGERLSGALFGARKSMTWTSSQDMIDFYDIKGVVEVLLQTVGVAASGVVQDGLPKFLHPGEGCRVMAGQKHLGFLGMVSPELSRQYEFAVPVGVFELDIDALVALYGGSRVKFAGVARFPGIRRDVSFLVDEKRAADELLGTFRENAPSWLKDVTLFDVYRGDNIPAGKKAMTYALWYQDNSRTLTDDEINTAHQAVIESVKNRVGAQIR